MVKAIVRFGMSVALGLAMSLPFVRLVPSLMPVAHAQPLAAEDIINPQFGDATGLGQGDLKQTIGNLIRVALGFLGVVAVVIVLYGGFKWMVAGGNDEKVGEAKKLIISGIIGLAIILSAYAITTFVISSFMTATTA
ncbi:MAG: pilin [Patescibacteria group bacterium]|jgi:hypothetical protein